MQERRAKVLLIGEAATLAHVARTAVLAGFLPLDEFDVTMACDARYSGLLGETAWPVRNIRSQPSETLLANARTGKPLFDLETLIGYVEEELALIDELQPDIVVGDMRVSLAVSTRLRRIPYVNVLSAQWSPKSELPLELPDDPVTEMVPVGPLADLLRCFARPLAMAWGALPLNVLRVHYGLPPVSHDLREVLSYGDYVVYPDAVELAPCSSLLPRHRYLGPLLWSARTELPAWWKEVPADRPVVYVNLGSSGAGEYLEMVLRVLARMPVTVIVATGSSCESTKTGNCYRAAYLPAEEALRRSALFINNGGSMSSQQSLHAGVPVLGLVTHADQFVFSKAVESSGAGEYLTPKQMSETAVAGAVNRILHTESYRTRAGWLREKLSVYDPAEAFVSLVREIVKNPAVQRV